MTSGIWSYPPELLDALLRAGLKPTATTPPALVREAYDDLYKLELRRLRDQRRAGVVAKADYYGRVVALRKQYWPLTLRLPAWEKLCKCDSP